MLIAILQQTPRWVWVLLTILIVIGVRQSLPRRRSLRSATIIPVVMIVLSFYGVISVFATQPIALAAWIVGVAGALLLFHLAGAWNDIRWSVSDQTLLVPGSMVPLMLMLGLFFVKFSVNVMLARHHDLASDMVFASLVGLAYGSFSGTFLSRGLMMWKVGRKGLQLGMAH